MKKIYFAPTTFVVKVQTDKLLSTGSANFSDGTESLQINSGNATDAGLSHSSSIWDDEEEY